MESSLNKYNINKNTNKKLPNKYLKNINAIKEQLFEIKYTINSNSNNNNEDLYNNYPENNYWCNKIKTRNFIFYDYIVELLNTCSFE